MTVRVAVVVSHPIQHFCPQYVSWAALEGVELHVFFAARIGAERYFDADFGRELAWDALPMAFAHTFLEGAAERKTSAGIDAPALDAALGAFAPDLVVVYGYAVPLQRRAIAWAGARGVRLAMISDAELRSPRPLWKSAAKQVLVRRWIARIDAFLTVGDTNEAYYRAYGARDAQFFRAGFPIDRARFDAALPDRAARRSALRARLGIPEDHLVALSVGKLIARKRQGDLVALANRLAGRGITLILAGSGPDEARLRAAAALEGAGGTVFAGFVQPVELIDHYLASDIYLHPADFDPHPLSVTEGIYCGCPAIVSDRIGSYGPTDDVRPGVNGFVHPVGDLAAMEGSVLRLADPALRAEMANASTRIARAGQARAHGGALTAAIAALGLGGRGGGGS